MLNALKKLFAFGVEGLDLMNILYCTELSSVVFEHSPLIIYKTFFGKVDD